MKKILLASALSFLTVAPVMAKKEKITFDSVLDQTTDQAYSKAGGNIQIAFRSGGNVTQIFNVTEQHINTNNPQKPFGEINWSPTVDEEATKFEFTVGSRGNLVPKRIKTEEVARDPANPLDHRYNIIVKDYVPGPAGTKNEGSIVVEITEP